MGVTEVRARIDSAISFVREGKGGYRAASEATGVTFDVVRRECKALNIPDIKPTKGPRNGKYLCAVCGDDVIRTKRNGLANYSAGMCGKCHAAALAKGRAIAARNRAARAKARSTP